MKTREACQQVTFVFLHLEPFSKRKLDRELQLFSYLRAGKADEHRQGDHTGRDEGQFLGEDLHWIAVAVMNKSALYRDFRTHAAWMEQREYNDKAKIGKFVAEINWRELIEMIKTPRQGVFIISTS